jgi:hypothetical protein
MPLDERFELYLTILNNFHNNSKSEGAGIHFFFFLSLSVGFHIPIDLGLVKKHAFFVKANATVDTEDISSVYVN